MAPPPLPRPVLMPWCATPGRKGLAWYDFNEPWHWLGNFAWISFSLLNPFRPVGCLLGLLAGFCSWGLGPKKTRRKKQRRNGNTCLFSQGLLASDVAKMSVAQGLKRHVSEVAVADGKRCCRDVCIDTPSKCLHFMAPKDPLDKTFSRQNKMAGERSTGIFCDPHSSSEVQIQEDIFGRNAKKGTPKTRTK